MTSFGAALCPQTPTNNKLSAEGLQTSSRKQTKDGKKSLFSESTGGGPLTLRVNRWRGTKGCKTILQSHQGSRGKKRNLCKGLAKDAKTLCSSYTAASH
jgi:hypothetical protein